MARPRALIAWSSGKDSAWALHAVRQEGTFEVVGALSTLTDAFRRVSMHGVREEIVRAQADALALPFVPVRIPYPCPNAAYEAAMGEVLAAARPQGITHVIFGDLFLPDVRAYREQRLAAVGMQAVFPLWGRPTDALAREMLAGALAATLVCVDPRALAPAFAGRAFDAALLAALPAGVDPCGENGEFHTCVTAGPMFAAPVPVRPGIVTVRDGFVFADLLPGPPGAPRAVPPLAQPPPAAE